MRTFSGTTTEELFCEPIEPSRSHGSGIQLRALPSLEAVAHQAAKAMLQACLESPRRPLGLATGRTMAPVYGALQALMRERSDQDQQIVRQHWCSFNLDEYVGLGPENPGSFASEMVRHLCQPLGIHPDRVHLPNGLAADPATEAHRYQDRKSTRLNSSHSSVSRMPSSA